MVTPTDRPRVLLIAEAANPEWSSVPLVGWSHSRALAQIVDGHLVTQIRNREAILRAGLVEGKDFTAIDSERIERPVFRLSQLIRGGKGKGWTTATALSSLTYYYFEHMVWKEFGERILSKEFDVVHRITPLSPTAPSLLATRCRKAGVPFIMGPLNGGLPWPKEYNSVRLKEREWLSFVRSAYRLMPGFASTLRDAAAILVASMATWDQMPKSCLDRCIYIPENAIDPTQFPYPQPRQTSKPIRLVFVGRLVPYKGAHLALKAAAPFLRDGTMTFDIVGDGPQRPEIEALVEQEKITSNVTLHGLVDHAHVARIMGDSDLLVFPSIREFGGGVVLEAMAMGAVPMVVNYGGPAELATPETGFLLDLSNPETLTKQIQELLGRIAQDTSLIDTRRELAIRRARTLFTWPAKALQVMEVYRWVMGQRPDKPDFSMPLLDEEERQLVGVYE